MPKGPQGQKRPADAVARAIMVAKIARRGRAQCNPRWSHRPALIILPPRLAAPVPFSLHNAVAMAGLIGAVRLEQLPAGPLPLVNLCKFSIYRIHARA
jgi:hypothetical protein